MPPPRPVPPRLRAQLAVGLPLVVSSAVFVLAAAMGIPLIAGTDPFAAARFAGPLQEAPGWTEGVRPTKYSENDHRVYRHDYVFLLPDGTRRPGHSYTTSQRLAFARQPVNPAVGRPPDLVVEYRPERPDDSRIRGTRTAPVSAWAGGFMLPFLMGGTVAVLVCLFLARSRVRLFRDGALTPGVVVACRAPDDDQTRDVPPAEFRRRLEEARRAGPLPPFAAKAPLLWRFMSVEWALYVFVFLVGGVCFAGVVLVNELRGNNPGGPNPRRALETLGFLAVWVAFCGFMLYFGVWARRVSTPPEQGGRVRCTVEFRPPDGGDPVRVEGTVPAAVVEADAPLPVLSLPDRPRKALVLAGVSPPVEITDEGRWRPTTGARPYWHAALVTLVLAGGLLLGWLNRDALW